MSTILLRFSLYFLIALGVFTTVNAQVIDSALVVEIHDIIYEGNKKTKPQIISREFSFKRGEKYTLRELDSMFVWDGNRIYNTNLFNSVDFEIDFVSNDAVDIRVLVDERWYLYPIPIFRLVDRNFNDWWVNRNRDLSRVNLGLNLTQYNFRGRNERLRVVGQTGFTDRLALAYRLPYIEKKQRHGLDLQFAYREAKNLAYNTFETIPEFLSSEELLESRFETLIVHSFRSSFYSFHRTSFGHTSINIADTIAFLNPNFLSDSLTHQKSLQLGYTYVWDKRNNRNYPTDGAYFSSTLNKVGLNFYDDVNYWVFNGRFAKYQEIKKNVFLHSYIEGLASLPRERDYFNYFAIGRQQSILRGYDLNLIESSSYFINRNDIKFKVFSIKKNISQFMPVKQFQTFPVTLFAKAIFDHGFAEGYPNYDGSDLLTDRYLYSYGVGLDFLLIYDAVIRLEYTRNTLGQTNFFINFGGLL